jgi:TolB protein
VLALTAAAAGAAPSEATYPGSNGRIAVTAVVGEECPPDASCLEDWFVAFGDAGGRGPLQLMGCDQPCEDGARAWSPDGRRLAFARGGHLAIANADGTSPTVLAPFQIGEASWSPDGQELLFSQPGGLYFIRSDGGDLRRFTGGDWPAWSSRNRIAFVRGVLREQIYTIKPDGTSTRRLTHGGRNRAPDFSPDGRAIAFERCATERRCDFERYDIYLIRPNGSGLRRLTRRGGTGPSWSPDGRYVLFERETSRGSRIYQVRPNGRGLRRLRYTLPQGGFEGRWWLTNNPNLRLWNPTWQPVPGPHA